MENEFSAPFLLPQHGSASFPDSKTMALYQQFCQDQRCDKEALSILARYGVDGAPFALWLEQPARTGDQVASHRLARKIQTYLPVICLRNSASSGSVPMAKLVASEGDSSEMLQALIECAAIILVASHQGVDGDLQQGIEQAGAMDRTIVILFEKEEEVTLSLDADQLFEAEDDPTLDGAFERVVHEDELVLEHLDANLVFADLMQRARGEYARAVLRQGIRLAGDADLQGALRAFQGGATLCEQSGDRHASAMASFNAARIQNQQGNGEGALAALSLATLRFREVNDRKNEANALVQAGLIQREQHHLDAALSALAAAAAIRRNLGPVSHFVAIQSLLAETWLLLKPSEALGVYQEMLLVTRKVAYTKGQVQAQEGLAQTYECLGNEELVLASLARARELASQLKDRGVRYLRLTLQLAEKLEKRGLQIKAGNLYAEAAAWHQQAGDQPQCGRFHQRQVSCYLKAAQALNQRGAFSKVPILLKTTIRLCLAQRLKQLEAQARFELGLVFAQLQEREKSVEAFRACVAVADELGNRKLKVAALSRAGMHLFDLGRVDSALELLGCALLIQEEMAEPAVLARLLDQLAVVLLATGRTEEAHNHCLRLLQLAKSQGLSNFILIGQQRLGHCCFRLHRYQRGVVCFHEAAQLAMRLGQEQEAILALISAASGYLKLGDSELAFPLYHHALEWFRKRGDQERVASLECLIDDHWYTASQAG